MARRGLRILSHPLRLGRSIRRGCRFILILLLLLSCLSCAALAILVRQAAAAEPPTDVMLVIDNSNSMFDRDGVGSDPELRRIEAAQMFISYLGIDTQASHRLGVIFFGGEAELVVPLTVMSDKERRDEMASLIAHPERMDWTDPAAALSLSREALLAERDAEHRSVVVLLTDGKPEWDNNPTSAEQAAAVDALKRIGQRYVEDDIALFTVLLSNDTTDADPEISGIYAPLWQTLTGATGGRFYAVRRAQDLFAIYHDVLVALSHARSADPVVETTLEGERQREIVPVEPGLARVTFLVHRSSRDVEVALYRPDGRILGERDGDVRHANRETTAIWAVTHPRPGDWEVSLDGRGTVTVWKDDLPAPTTPSQTPTATREPTPTAAPSPVTEPTPTLMVKDWPEASLAGEPILLSAGFDTPPARRPDVWIASDVGDKELVPQSRLLDDGRAGDSAAGDGQYDTFLTPETPGLMLVRVWAEVEGEVISSWEGRLQVEPRPALQLAAPQTGETWEAGSRVPIEAHWMVGAEEWADGGPVTATLYRPDGKVSWVMTATLGQPLVTEAPKASGTYTLTVKATTSTPGGSLHRGEVTRTVAVRHPLPAWIWLGGTGIMAITGGAWWVWRRHRRLPRLVGRIRVLEAPSAYVGPSLTDLSSLNCRSAQIGGERAELGLPPEGTPWAEIRALIDESGLELTVGNGRPVRVNGYVLTGPHLLADGDTIATDDIKLRYEHLRYGL